MFVTAFLVLRTSPFPFSSVPKTETYNRYLKSISVLNWSAQSRSLRLRKQGRKRVRRSRTGNEAPEQRIQSSQRLSKVSRLPESRFATFWSREPEPRAGRGPAKRAPPQLHKPLPA